MNASRYEFKYFLDREKFEKIYSEIKLFTQKDNFLKNKKFYYVNSVYFDTVFLMHYIYKLEGQKKRKKIRIRTYSSEFEFGNIYFSEIKNKNDKIFFKYRKKISKSKAYEFIKYSCPILNSLDTSEFSYEFLRHHLIPSVNIIYKRIALFAEGDFSVRISFDYDLQVKNVKTKFRKLNVFNDDKIIFEIKFHKYFPRWLWNIVKKYNLVTESISKYCYGIEKLKRGGVLTI